MANKGSVKVKPLRMLPMSEDVIQKSVVQHLTLRGSPAIYWFHVPNGGSRHIAEAVKLKAMGTRAGVADLVLIIGGRAHFLELKTRKGKQSNAQKIAAKQVEMSGATYALAHSIDEALDTLQTWGAFSVGKPPR